MATANDVIAAARREIGYHETGGAHNDGNVTKYWAALDPAMQGNAWCGAFVSYIFREVHAPIPPIDKPYGFVGCEDAHAWARGHAMLDTSGHYRPGDVVLFDFGANGHADHTGIVVSDDGHKVVTIEGNTSGDYAGDQRNGGCVAQKVRYHGATLLGVLKMSSRLAAPKPPAHRNPYVAPKANLATGAHDVPHYLGVHWVQWALAVACDGSFGPVTDAHVRAFQRSHRLGVDGVVGPITRSALARVTR